MILFKLINHIFLANFAAKTKEMELEERIAAFALLGDYLRNLPDEEFAAWSEEARRQNAWFTTESIRSALLGIAAFLDRKELTTWLSGYKWQKKEPKTVGVVMAGNIPLVGFHDYLSVLVSGNRLLAKLSSSDSVLLKKITARLSEIEPRFQDRVVFSEKIGKVDAVIATGSDNSARYFHYYFSSIPHIIRYNRVSCAILNGEESEEELSGLGKDILMYFGMGCRNVAKLYVPEGYIFNGFYEAIERHKPLIDINKYYNNYDYNKSIFVLNKTPFLDNGFLLLAESSALASPVSVVYYEYYKSLGEVTLKLEAQQDKIQTMVSGEGWFAGSVPFGKAQFPSVTDYADGVDTIEFLMNV